MNFIRQLRIDERFLSSIALLSILLGGLWVRISGISEYYLNADEIQFIIIAKGETLAEVWRRGLVELHPPLAHFIRHYLLMITPDVFQQRLFGAAAGMVSIIGMYQLGFQLRGRFLGLFCASCMAFFPVAVSTSITIRNYAFFMAFLSWALYFFMRYQMQEKRSDLLYFTLLLFLASATHFTGFLVGAALGISEGLRLASAKRWNNFALLCISFLPLLLLGIFFYFHYLAPGTAGPMWKHFTMAAAAPNEYSDGFLAAFIAFIKILSYFVPLGIVELKSNTNLFILLFSGLLLFSMYIKCTLRMHMERPTIYTLILVIWGIAIFAALANFYPFSPDRHSYYLLPFFVLPLGYELENFFRSIHNQRFARYFGITLIVLTVFFFKTSDIYLKYDEEFPLKRTDFNAGQAFLDQHLQANDIIVTERFAYHYFVYDKDAGTTPYDSYDDVLYHHNTTVLAPSDAPFKPYYSWEPFRDNLKSRLDSSITTPKNKIWFVMYSAINQEIWHLMSCDAISPQINDYFSRDGVLIFSIQVNVLSGFLKDNAAWKFCYSDYNPRIDTKPFKAYPKITQFKEVTHLPAIAN